MRMDWQAKLLGTLDLLFMMPRGLDAFSGDQRTAIRTFVAAQIASYPLMLVSYNLTPPKGMEDFSPLAIVLNVTVHYAICLIAGLVLGWQVAKALRCPKRFWLGMEAGAWVNLVLLALVVPLELVDAWDLAPPATLERVWIGLTIYSFIQGGFMLRALYRINLSLTIGLVIVGFFIDRETWNALHLLQGLPLLP